MITPANFPSKRKETLTNTANQGGKQEQIKYPVGGATAGGGGPKSVNSDLTEVYSPDQPRSIETQNLLRDESREFMLQSIQSSGLRGAMNPTETDVPVQRSPNEIGSDGIRSLRSPQSIGDYGLP